MRVPRWVIVAALVSSGAAHASFVFNVNSTADKTDLTINGVCEAAAGSGECTLRAAIMEANALAATAVLVTINLPAGHYTLTIPRMDPNGPTNGDLDLMGKISIVGAGAAVTVIDANQIDRVMTTAAGSTVTLSGVTLRNGRRVESPGNDAFAGGIYDQGSLTLVKCVVENNESLTTTGLNGGGGILSASNAALSLLETVVQGNKSHGFGGGIYAASGSTVALTDTVVRDNTTVYTSESSGGGLFVASGATATLLRSTVSGNQADYGGGLTDVGSLRVTNCTFAGNQSNIDGGGLFLAASSVLANVTVAGNFAGAGLQGGTGSGMFLSGTISVIANNSVFQNINGGDRTADDCDQTASSYISSTYNLIPQPGRCTVIGSYTASDPLLGPVSLADNGGLTQTLMPPVGSPAIGGGDPFECKDAFSVALTTDQRGVKRPIGARCDLGAVEVEPKGDVNGDGLVNVSDVFYLVNFLFAGGAPPLGRANVNGDGAVGVGDVFYLINYLFAGGSPPV